jgi:hypothetical protein
MKLSIQHLLFSALVGLLISFASCSKTPEAVDEAIVTEATDEALYSVQERGGIGRLGCYELIFPVSIQLPDSTIATVNSYDEMKTAIRNWYLANGTGGGTSTHPHGGNRFAFVYPISVMNSDGVVITVNNETELRALRADCQGTFNGPGGGHGGSGGGHHGHGNNLRCFDFVWPITIAFPDGSTAAANSGQEMHQMIKDWKTANPGAQGRPTVVFPVTVQMFADSSLVVVNSKSELHQLKKDCQ